MWPLYQPLASRAAMALSPRFSSDGDIVGLIAHPFAVVGPVRGEHMVAHALPVDMHLIKTQRGGIKNGLLDRRIQGKRFAQIAERTPDQSGSNRF